VQEDLANKALELERSRIAMQGKIHETGAMLSRAETEAANNVAAALRGEAKPGFVGADDILKRKAPPGYMPSHKSVKPYNTEDMMPIYKNDEDLQYIRVLKEIITDNNVPGWVVPAAIGAGAVGGAGLGYLSKNMSPIKKAAGKLVDIEKKYAAAKPVADDLIEEWKLLGNMARLRDEKIIERHARRFKPAESPNIDDLILKRADRQTAWEKKLHDKAANDPAINELKKAKKDAEAVATYGSTAAGGALGAGIIGIPAIAVTRKKHE
jgi:hypothetical protein